MGSKIITLIFSLVPVRLKHGFSNLLKLGGSLGNVPQKMKKKTCYEKSIYFGLLVHF
jgi:hypothetical protein